MTQRARAKAEMHAHILTTARRLFNLHGYEDVTHRMIARAANTSTGAIFANFTGKDDLFVQAMGRRPISDNMGLTFVETLRILADGRGDRELAAAVVRSYEVAT